MENYDLIVVGSSFASSFFLLRYLEKRPKDRILVLERGGNESHAWKIENRHLMDISGVVSRTDFHDTYQNLTPDKPWVYTPSFGGSSNCWYACAPRFLPNDFKLKSIFGVAEDWPITYDDLETYYSEAEDIMAVAGPSEHSPFRRSKPYPQLPHNINDVDRALMKAYPDSYFVMPAARPTQSTKNRPRCCASGVCNLCPVDSKFTILNELSQLYQKPNVTVKTSALVFALDIVGGVCSAVRYKTTEGEFKAAGALVALGANPIFNAHILLNSGLSHPWLGAGLTEQVAFSCSLYLNGINNFSGSTVATGHGYMLYDGIHRREYSACLIENINAPRLRIESGKYLQKAFLKFIFEDIPSQKNKVSLSQDLYKPQVEFHSHSDYLQKGIDETKKKLPELFAPLPVERIEIHENHPTEGHIMCTARMGDLSENSVVDKHQVLHQVRNVLSLGGSSFTSVSPANPTLTIAAMSLWSADKVVQ